MTYEHNPGTGAIFKTEKKTDKYPDYSGTIKTPDGQSYSIALWTKEGKKGKFFSAKVQDPYHAAESSTEDLPF